MPGPMDPRRVLHIIRSVGAPALDYAHRRGLVHWDMKPANILLAPATGPADDARAVILTDFGIAKAMDTDVRLTGTGQAFLTPAYSAPERFGTTPIDSRVDVYSLGCVAFELLTDSCRIRTPTSSCSWPRTTGKPCPTSAHCGRNCRPASPGCCAPPWRRTAKSATQLPGVRRGTGVRLRRRDLPPVPPPRPSAPTTVHGTGPGTGPRNPTPVGGWTPESVAMLSAAYVIRLPGTGPLARRRRDRAADREDRRARPRGGDPRGRRGHRRPLRPDEDPTGAAAAVPGPTYRLRDRVQRQRLPHPDLLRPGVTWTA